MSAQAGSFAAADCMPEPDGLVAGLNAIFGERGPVVVLARKPNAYASSSRSEIVTCRLRGGSELKLLVKYGRSDGEFADAIAYEAEFYTRILEPLRAPAPKFYGSHRDLASGQTWLVLEFLENVLVLDDLSDADSMALAATWLGRFHAACDRELRGPAFGFLKTYDAGYYAGFARRAVEAAEAFPAELEWLSPLQRSFEQFIAPLDRRPTVSHGDYYQHNILFRNGTVHPIDWEFGGIEAGELDLACLTDGWPESMESQCALAYCRARWPEGAPGDFERVFDAARLAICCHNVGVRPDWTIDEEAIWYCKRLRRMAENRQLI